MYRPLEGKRGSVLEICGSRANLEIAEYVHEFLTHSCHRLWIDHQRAQGLRSNRERRTFQSGVMAGFSTKLGRESKKHRAQGLVWVKDGDLGNYFRRRHPHIRNVRYGGSPRSDAWHKGREAGETMKLGLSIGYSGARLELPVDRVLLAERPLSDVLTRYLNEITPTKKGHRQEASRLKIWLWHCANE